MLHKKIRTSGILSLNLREIGCGLWCFLAFFHIPVYTRENDVIGLYDLILLLAVPLWAASAFQKLARTNLCSRRMLPLYAYLLFLGCTGFSMLLNPDRIIFPFGFLLYLKQFEYVFMVLITIWIFNNVDAAVSKRCIAMAAMAMVFYSGAVFVLRHDWNMQVPFAAAGSGVVLGATAFTVILFLLFGRKTGEKTHWLIIAMLFVCGLFSMGRTQIIAFVVATAFWLARSIASKPKGAIAILLAGIAFALMYAILMIYNPFQISWYDNDPLRFLYAPQLVFQDASFMLRFQSVWMESLPLWISSWDKLLFGVGFGSQRYIDGLYFNLLFTTGLTGIIAYLAFHLALLTSLRSYGYLFIFWITTSITNEVLLNSYRYVQVAALIVAWLWLHRNMHAAVALSRSKRVAATVPYDPALRISRGVAQ